MNRQNKKCHLIICFKLAMFISTSILSNLPFCDCLPVEAIILKANQEIMKQLPLPVKSQFDIGYLSNHHQFKLKQTMWPQWSEHYVKSYFQIEPADAIDSAKYSQPDIDYHQVNPYLGQEVPSKSFSRVFPIQVTTPHVKNINMQQNGFLKNSSKPSRDLRFMESSSQTSSQAVKKEYSHKTNKINLHLNRMSSSMDENNFTDKITNLLPVSSETVLTYGSLSRSTDIEDSKYIVSVKKSAEQTITDIPSQLDNVKADLDSNPSTLLPVSPDHINTQSSAVLNTQIYVEFANDHTESIESRPSSSILPSSYDVENVSSSLSFDVDAGKLSTGSVAGIVIGVLVCVTILSSSVIYLLYRKYNGKCTSVVESKFNSDNCGYLDDSLHSSIYLNNHIELPKESSEEMSSLDNDSFLNSLETMTIQNYWAESSKNTKV